MLSKQRDNLYNEGDLNKTLQALNRFAYSTHPPPELLVNILEAIKMNMSQPSNNAGMCLLTNQLPAAVILCQ